MRLRVGASAAGSGHVAAAWLVASTLSCWPSLGFAEESRPLVQFTQASSVLYNFDNRDTRPGQVGSLANDHSGMLYNRSNLQVTSGRWTGALRVDQVWFFASPEPLGIARQLQSLERFGDEASRQEFERNKIAEAGLELSNRYINWVYPAQYRLTYTTPELELSAGDGYAQFGRGLVLSLRKLDEIASDTTLRGLRVTARKRVGSARIQATALGGSLNPLRIDEASGRYLGVNSSVTPGWLAITEAGMPRAVHTDFTSDSNDCSTLATCSYAPDRLVGGQFLLDVSGVTLGTQAAWLVRGVPLSNDLVRTAQSVGIASQSFEIPSFAKHGSLYLEGAVQKLSRRDQDAGTDFRMGHAIYGTLSWVEPRFSLLFEAKHYRRFFPLAANVSNARVREFSLLQYNAPPTTEESWNDTQFGGLNTCVSGARLKGQVFATRAHAFYGWVSHYQSFAESVRNERCDTARENANLIWDTAIGLDLRPSSRRARWDLNLGVRFDDTHRELAGPSGPTTVFYRELALRYNITEPLSAKVSLELQGVHRRRRETVGGPEQDFVEGRHSTAFEWGERFGAGIGLEYDTRPDTPHGYVNGMVTYRPSDAWSLALFAGQRRGALRCVGGVCRVYPPFEGVRLDATFRY
ncbi:MAG TPA: hypothetical protein VFQ61_11040 [Polyangiaceae bacterium]|nr:hypothetical protein [Polyangiaceae bacterium]